jgi:hypothetical protein
VQGAQNAACPGKAHSNQIQQQFHVVKEIQMSPLARPGNPPGACANVQYSKQFEFAKRQPEHPVLRQSGCRHVRAAGVEQTVRVHRPECRDPAGTGLNLVALQVRRPQPDTQEKRCFQKTPLFRELVSIHPAGGARRAVLLMDRLRPVAIHFI